MYENLNSQRFEWILYELDNVQQFSIYPSIVGTYARRNSWAVTGRTYSSERTHRPIITRYHLWDSNDINLIFMEWGDCTIYSWEKL